MSFDALRWAFACNVGSSAERLVLLALANDCRNPNFLAFPSRERLHLATQLDPKTITAAMKKLEEAHLVSATGEYRGRTGRIPVYRVLVGNGSPLNQPKNGFIESGKFGAIQEHETSPDFRTNHTEIPARNGSNSTKNGGQNQLKPNQAAANRAPATRTNRPYPPPAAANLKFPRGISTKLHGPLLGVAKRHRLNSQQTQLMLDVIDGRVIERGRLERPLVEADEIAAQICAADRRLRLVKR